MSSKFLPESDECHALEAHLAELQDCMDYDLPKCTGPAGFIVESIQVIGANGRNISINLKMVQGVGGTVQYPRNYLRKAFEAINAKGGLTICDEVQTGFGRLGTHFWGFESQQAKPDIVTLAKGIANGFPMGALVTSKEIAAAVGKAFYFNTYGGNPLACTAAKAVLEAGGRRGNWRLFNHV
jgi:alanine-glyoxylate transaminase/(R)-3-amino-2-methylpropionate-pyruvate transaminase